MRKNILFLLFALIFFFLSSLPSSAQELTIQEATESSEPSTMKKNEYELPYPGILPDNPLYFLKAIRDRIIDFLIVDHLKKADFYLLQADKRLNAGVYLFKKKDKHPLAESTISKGENYFEKAIAKVKEAESQGIDIADISRRLYEASGKHKEVIKELGKNVDSNIKTNLERLVKRIGSFEKQVDSLRK